MNEPIKLSVIYQGFEMIDEMTCVYLNTETQEIECHYVVDEDDDETKFEDEKYLPFPTRYDINEYKWMENFSNDYPDKKISIGLQVAIVGTGAFQRFKMAIQAYGITKEWYAYKKDRRVSLSIEWCEEHNIKYINDIE